MFEIGTASSYTDLLDKLNTFLTAKGSAFGLSFAGTGSGTFTAYSGGSASVAETFQITCTAAATNGGTFSVVGSVSGSLGSATVGTPFTSSQLNFTINDGATDFIVGDKFVISTAPKWVAQRSNAGSEYIWKAPGNDGLSSIYVGASVFSNVTADYYNWRLGGFTGFNSALAFTAQPGACTGPCLALWNNSIPYWFVCNGRRVVVVAKVSTVYETAYLGHIEQYPSPTQYPYPLAVGGTMAFASEPAATSTNWRWSSTLNSHSAFPIARGTTSAGDSSMRLRNPAGTWDGFIAYNSNNLAYGNAALSQIWPYSNGMTDMRANLDGSYPLFSVVLHDATPNVHGRLDGISATTGSSLAAETVLSGRTQDYLIIPSAYRSSKVDYFAVQLG